MEKDKKEKSDYKKYTIGWVLKEWCGFTDEQVEKYLDENVRCIKKELSN
ncbi:hypothetical protein [Halalkalibacillus sediminis]|nr:hypothetical protein [Halalkalibacillus sediminis]